MVPMAPSWVISKTRNVVAKLNPEHANKRYAIEIRSGVSAAEMAEAEDGTVRGGRLVHPMNTERFGVEIKTIRGDYRDADGNTGNRLRLWSKSDFKPRPDDIFQERLYCIQWITKESLGKGRETTFFGAVTEDDLAREKSVETIVASKLARWQAEGLVPDMPIEPGEKTDEPIRTRGWTHWHHLFTPRNLLFYSIMRSIINELKGTSRCALLTSFSKTLDWGNKLCYYGTGAARESISHLFYNQAFNPFFNYGIRGVRGLLEHTTLDFGLLQVTAHP
jgi:putative DNA methylase